MSRKILLLATEPATAEQYERLLCADGHEVQCRDWNAFASLSTGLEGAEVVIAVLTAAEPAPAVVVRQLKAADSSRDVVIISRNPSVQAAIGAMREGAADFNMMVVEGN